ncbi:ATP-dependent RNA helicase DDX24 [Megalops cyprinoides]|uniref:ATP-dependent RNA helicase DDX24 n=1 Tax=Megalops cyprinoides TaxID=118141 RepID=UPI001864CF4F|nr:ATP-dependent RNA helicase DDX24 [Megalops cyprinoides]
MKMKAKKLQHKGKEVRNGTKPTKRGILVKGSWKAVELDPSLFSEEDMGGLVCFEELTDYRLVNSAKAVAKAGTKGEKEKEKKGKKRKASEAVEGETGGKEAGEGGSESKEESTQPAKKKRKKKRKGKKEEQSDTPTVEVGVLEGAEAEKPEESVAPEQAVTPEEDSQMHPTKGKKTKKKKKVKKERDQAVQEPETSDNTAPPAKAAPPSKKRAKNWTNAALSGASGMETDVSAWKDLFVPEPVLQALGALGFSAPTPIQALALPPAIRDRMDILGAAETGSGKTLSFGIPMIHAILGWRQAQERKSEGVQDQANPGTQVKSLYLPEEQQSDEEPSTAGTEEEKGVQTGEADEEEVEQGAGEEDAEEANEGEEQYTQEGDTEEEEDTQEGDSEEDDDDDSQKLGCVKVIEDMEFDFDTAGKTEVPANQKQPLLGLILTPTRELAVQVKHHIDAVAQFTGIKTAIVVGGMAPQKQNRVLNRRPEIVIATPGRLWEMIKERHPHLLNLKQLRCLVIDEADRMVEKGHFAELENLLEMLNESQFSPERQTFVFSATLTMVHQTPTRILQKKKGKKLDQRSKLEILMEKVGIKAKPKVIDLTRKEATVETLTETRIHCDKDEKDFYLYYFLLQYPGRTMVFANSIDCIKRLNSLLTILDCTPLPLHANMHQKQRLKNLERFAERESSVLLTTDVAARGLDIPNVQHVIHYQVPRTSETYVHRSGRTARATKEGLSLLLIGPDDMMNFKKIYRTLGKDEDLPMFPIQTKCMAMIKERVNLARKIEKIEFHNSREKHHNSWFKQAAEALEVDLDDDVLLGGRKDEDDERQQQRMVKGMKKHMKHLLSQPIFKNVMKTKYPTQMGKLSLPELPLASVRTALDCVASQKHKQKKKKKQQQQQKQ